MTTPAGWYPDPTNRHQNRWFDGNDWTDQVADGQAVSTDPVQGGPAAAATPAPTPDPAATAAVPVASGPPPGAPGGTSPLGGYTGPTAGSSSGGNGKTFLIVGVVAAVLIAVVVALGLTLGGGDDGGSGEAADFSSPADEPAADTTTTTNDPSASDIFDDMADTDNSGGDIFGTEDSPADSPADSTVPPADSGGDAYPQDVIDNFNSSCTGAGSPASFCNCVIDALQTNVPYDRFVEIDQQLAEDPNNIPSELTDAATGCQ